MGMLASPHLREVDAAGDGLYRAFGVRLDVEAEDLGGEGECGAGVGNVHDAADTTFHRGRAQNGIRLGSGVAELLQVCDRVQARLAVRDVHVEVMLFTGFVHGDTLEDQVRRVVRLEWARLEDGRGNPVFRHTLFDDVHAQVEVTGHFDRA